MADEDEFSFDLNSIRLDDIQLDPSELAEYGLSPDEVPIDLKSIQAMADASMKNPAVQGNFGMIRVQRDSDADFNVDEMALTAEDMKDPDLLAELGILLGNQPTKMMAQAVQEAAVDDDDLPFELKMVCDDKGLLEKYIAEEKKHAVMLKQAGDVEGARAALRSFKALQTRLAELNTNILEELNQEALPSNVNELKRMAVEAKRSGDLGRARELMTRIVKTENAPCPTDKPQVSAGERSRVKQIMQQLSKQIEQCIDAAKIHMKTGSKGEASSFVTRKKAFEADLLALKAAYLGNKSAPEVRKVSIVVPVDLENIDVAEEELKVLIAGVGESMKAGRKSKESLLDQKSDHFVKVSLAWPPDFPQECSTPMFKLSTIRPLNERVTFIGIKRDLKGLKFFEHQKIRLDLYRKETSFLRTKSVLLGSAQIKLSQLIMQPTIESQTLELVDEARRSVGMAMEVAMKLRRPISSKAVSSRTVDWIFFEVLSSGKLFSCPSSPTSALPPPDESVDIDSAMQAAKSDIDAIASYAVVEHELELLPSNPATLSNPFLSFRQLTLEAKRDTMDLQFQMGEVSFEGYLACVQTSLASTKKMALESKRSGQVEQARNYMMRVQIMEKELLNASEE